MCEIPRGSRPKFEIDTAKPYNPIVQDKTKDGSPRDYKLDSLSNYGARAALSRGSIASAALCTRAAAFVLANPAAAAAVHAPRRRASTDV